MCMGVLLVLVKTCVCAHARVYGCTPRAGWDMCACGNAHVLRLRWYVVVFMQTRARGPVVCGRERNLCVI